jgi:type II secretory pathway predicted ATPase ExeA
MKFGFFGDKLPIEQYSANRTVMYETHFGLNKKPFRALAAGSDVFVGPQTATTMAGLKKALAAADSIVAVAGPAGCGKTTLVRRALNSIGDQQLIVSIGRIQLGHDEVLELLLEEMGAEIPAGTVQRFTTFRRLLKEHAAKGSRIFVVVEDAARVGIDALSELEALTATDAGVSDGANIVLMGDEELDEVLNARRLVRLKQRLKLRQKVSPLSASELTAYFKHCFRLAGNEFDAVFEPGTSDLLHSLSGGVPRMANNLVESALSSAAENKQEQVGVALIKLVATEEFGLDTGVQVSEQEAVVEAVPVEAPPANVAPPEVAPVENEKAEEDEIPELIQDTLPDLAILAPALVNPSAVAKPPEVEEIIETAKVEEDADEPIPTLSDAVDGEIPPWERDPTLAQLRPDLDALEHAMAVAQGLEPDDEDESEQDGGEPEIPELVPEITLDREIQAKIEEAAELLKQEEAEANASESDDKPAEEAKPVVEARVAPRPPAKPEAPKPPATPEPPAAPEQVAVPVAPPEPEKAVEPPPEAPAVVAALPTPPPVEAPVVADDMAKDEEPEADPELEKIAVNIARAKTIDDCDDKMAETLFGEEFSMMAAQVAANAPAELSANDDIELAVADFDGAAAVNVEIKSDPAIPKSNLDGSASQRMRTVRALNADPGATPPVNGMNAPPPAAAVAPVEPPPANGHPESIEDQINTSMTQTLEALSIRPSSIDDDDDDDKGGFFSRFRRS